MMMPFGSVDAMPKRLAAGIQVFVVKKLSPAFRNALAARSTRNSAISPVISSTAPPAERNAPRNSRSPAERFTAMARGTSSSLGGSGAARNPSSGEVVLVIAGPSGAVARLRGGRTRVPRSATAPGRR